METPWVAHSLMPAVIHPELDPPVVPLAYFGFISSRGPIFHAPTYLWFTPKYSFILHRSKQVPICGFSDDRFVIGGKGDEDISRIGRY